MTPLIPGEMAIKVVIDYTDDFNEPRTIEQMVPVTVLEAPVIDPGINNPEGEGGVPPPVEETFMQKFLRFVKGMVGLDSEPPQTSPGIINMPVEGIPPTDSKPIQEPSGGKGG